MAKTIEVTTTQADITIDPLTTTFVQLFEQNTKRHPQKAVFIDHEREYTYADANAEINRIAQVILQRIGDDPAQVGLLLSNGYDFFRAVWAVLKAGKIAVPLDNNNAPLNHLEAIARSTNLRLVLTDDAFAEQTAALRQRVDFEVVNVAHLPTDAPTDNPALDIDPHRVFAVIHTSGSTGTPKGVQVNQTNSLRMIAYHLETGECSSTDVIGSFAAMTFSSTFMQLLRAPSMGGTYGYYDVKQLGTAGLLAWITKTQPNVIRFRPTLLRSFAAMLPEGRRFESVQHVVMGGEQPYKSDFDLFKKHFPETAIMRTSIGSTETFRITAAQYTHESTPDDGPLPPGTPFPLIKLTITGEDGKPQPPGVPGKIVVEGGTTAVGYWGTPDNATTRFEVIDEDQCIYRVWTNDLGMFREDGAFEFHGRSDDHVKIRGYRVQLNAVAAALLRLPNVKNAGVVVRNAPDSILVAFYSTKDGKPLRVADLRWGLAAHLPDYMLPSHYIHMDELPTLPSGKLDRKNLPEVDLSRRLLDAALVPPTTPTEKTLVRLYEQTLGVQPVGVTDNFFELGGTSLLAAQLMTHIKNVFGVELPMVLLLQGGSARQLAEVVVHPERAAWSVDTQFVSLHTGGKRAPLVFVHGREGDVMGVRPFIEHFGDAHGIYGIQSSESAATDVLKQAPVAIGNQYANLLRQRLPHGPYVLVGLSMGGLYALNIAQALVRVGAATPDQIMVVMLDTIAANFYQRNEMRRSPRQRQLHRLLYALLPGQRVRIRRMTKSLLSGTPSDSSRLLGEEAFSGKIVYVQCTLYAEGVPRPRPSMMRAKNYWQKFTTDFTTIEVDSWHDKVLWVPGAFEQFLAGFKPILEAFNAQQDGAASA